jgi:hypothetical protein
VNRAASIVALAAAAVLAGCAVSGGQNPRPSSRTGNTSPLDLNVATAAQLQTLPGITAAHARRIIANRPYKVKHELETRKILPAAVYRRIRDRVFATERIREDSAPGGLFGDLADVGCRDHDGHHAERLQHAAEHAVQGVVACILARP